MDVRRVLLFFIFIFCIKITAHSQHLEHSKTTIRANEEFRIVLTFPKDLLKDLKNHYFPEIQGFVKIKTSFDNLKETKEYRITQSYFPLKSGKFKLPAFTVKAGEKWLSFPETTIQVKPAASKPKLPPEFEKAQFRQEKEALYFRINSDKSSVYTGEGFTITASILIGQENKTAFNFSDLTHQLLNISRMLSTGNCLIDEHSKGMIEQLRFDTIQFDGKNYQRLKLYEAKVYPVSAQDIRFPQVEFRLLKYLTSIKDNDILWKAEDLKLYSRPLKIDVRPLPAHPLKDQVAVGAFQLRERVSSGSATTGKSVRYTFQVSGRGNISGVLPPKIRENEIFDFYTPEISEQNFVKNGERSTVKIFTYNMVPKEPGRHNLAEYFRWVYFDPEKHRYDTLTSRIVLTVAGESQKNKEISSTDLGSFYELAGKESNRLRSHVKEESIKFFANIIILFMLVTTAILIFRR